METKKKRLSEFAINSKEFSIHKKNLQVLVTEIYKTINGLAPPLMNSLFVL